MFKETPNKFVLYQVRDRLRTCQRVMGSGRTLHICNVCNVRPDPITLH